MHTPYVLTVHNIRTMSPLQASAPMSATFCRIAHRYSKLIEPLHAYELVLIFSSCLSTRLLASINRSTQFCMHGSSYLSSLPPEIFDVMHLRKHMSVRECIDDWI